MTNQKYILIAEDDSSYRNVLETKLSAEGFLVKAVVSGKELMGVINEKFPSLIILDIIMPDMDGFETIKNIKNLPGFSNIPILVLSSLGQKEDIDKVKQLGANEYLIKGTISLTELVNKIKNYFV